MSAQGQHVPLRLFNGLLAMGPKAPRILEAMENIRWRKFDHAACFVAWTGGEASETIECDMFLAGRSWLSDSSTSIESAVEGVSVRRQGAKPDRERERVPQVSTIIAFWTFRTREDMQPKKCNWFCPLQMGVGGMDFPIFHWLIRDVFTKQFSDVFHSLWDSRRIFSWLHTWQLPQKVVEYV